MALIRNKMYTIEIPYRTVTEWKLDNRHAPEYVLRLLEYYIRMENITKKSREEMDKEDI